MGSVMRRLPASMVLDAVERWASGCYMLREIELLVEAVDRQATRDAEQSHRVRSAGRLDSLLVPFKPWEAPFARKIGGWAWNTCRLVGIEVKVDRADLMAGLRKNQLGRYAEGVSAVYLATPKGLVKTSDVPARFGHLEIYKGDSSSGQPMYRCVCKRHAQFGDQQPAPADVLEAAVDDHEQPPRPRARVGGAVEQGTQKDRRGSQPGYRSSTGPA